MDIDRRLRRLEKRSGTNFARRIIYLHPNLEAEEPDETPYCAKITSELWAYSFGGPLKDEEIADLRAEYKDTPLRYGSLFRTADEDID